MRPPPPTLAEVAAFLADALRTDRYRDDPNGVLRAGERPVARLGLALEPDPGLRAWCVEARLDALLLHRPWGLDPDALPPGTGLLAYHLAFDEGATLGLNPHLASVMGLRAVETLGAKEGRPLGMVGDLAARPFADVAAALARRFGGLERLHPPAGGSDAAVARAAVVGAMTPTLVREAAARGAELYLTGAWRDRARPAVGAAGLGVVVVGHARAEAWGLRALAHRLGARFAGLDARVRPG